MAFSRAARKRSMMMVFGLCALVGILVVWDHYFETDIVGATGRFLARSITWLGEMLAETVRLVWRVALDGLAYGWRVAIVAVERMIAFAPSVATGRFTKFLWPMAMGVAANRYFTRTRRNGKSELWQRIKSEFLETAERIRAWWHRRHFVSKAAVVAVMIAVQVHLHWWLVLFPIGFLIPYLSMLLNSLQRWVLGPMVESWYLNKLGQLHRRLKAWLLTWQSVRMVVALYRLCKLYFETGWRIWYYDARFAFPEWRPFWRETVGRIRFAFVTLSRGEWGKRRMRNRPLLGGGVAHRVRSRIAVMRVQKNEVAG